jgi:hypothetical protein
MFRYILALVALRECKRLVFVPLGLLLLDLYTLGGLPSITEPQSLTSASPRRIMSRETYSVLSIAGLNVVSDQ